MAVADVGFEIIDVDTYTVGFDEARNTLHRIEHALEAMHGPLADALREFATHTRDWMESWGHGSYDPLAEATIEQKVAAGYSDPPRPLYATGEMFEAASTAPATIPGVILAPPDFSTWEALEHEAAVTLDWERDGWQIPVLHQEGVPERIVHRHAYTREDGTHVDATSYLWHLPSRPIFTIDEPLVESIASLIERHVWQAVI